ncbi:hypothetical protein HSBAA_30510 [Vreelandella sulfidaeris]|uniref:Antitoxin n=1 Tax=Vreelandella sulfidaeris TaxID=115553 RepID=A0A455U703_9GAMM|nr:hypothetical protein HSBAA_30510 [Halomonas sulfidaeris]
MVDVNIHDAKSQLSKLIEKAMAGDEVIIAKRGKPMVRLVPIEQESNALKLLGCMKDEIEYAEGWDAPWKATNWPAFTRITWDETTARHQHYHLAIGR